MIDRPSDRGFPESPRHAFLAVVLSALGALEATARADEHAHHGHGAPKPKVKPPKVYLDKSPRIVQYQLKRLDNERLLLVERKTDHVRFAPVFEAILKRAGMTAKDREEAIAGLVEIRKTDASHEILSALGTLDDEDPQDARTAKALAKLLLRQPQKDLSNRLADFAGQTSGETRFLRATAHAALISGGQPAACFAGDTDDAAQRSIDWLTAIPLLPTEKLRASVRSTIVGFLDMGEALEVRIAAADALRWVATDKADTFRKLAPLVARGKLRRSAVSTLLTVPLAERDPDVSRTLVETLVKYAEKTPTAKRTSDPFVDAMELADQTLARLPVAEARSFRARLREVAVRVVRIRTVEEEMRYDLPYFAVEAGRPIQIVLRNEDLMPHNLVITAPEALREVAELGAQAGPEGHGGLPYVPKSDKVLWATGMVQPEKQERLTFTAPKTQGEYPYVCTFPRHWVRMYGVMVVVEDLEAWSQNPTKPKDPIGSQREFVRSWTLDELAPELEKGLQVRITEIGQRLFAEATCTQCHKVGERSEGGLVGPDLAQVFERLKGDRRAVLQEIIEPSHRIDPKYAVKIFITATGRTITGIVTAEDKKTVSVLDNPESDKPLVLEKAQVVQTVDTEKSMMPKALLDRFTKDEIFEILSFLERAGLEEAGRK